MRLPCRNCLFSPSRRPLEYLELLLQSLNLQKLAKFCNLSCRLLQPTAGSSPISPGHSQEAPGTLSTQDSFRESRVTSYDPPVIHCSLMFKGKVMLQMHQYDVGLLMWEAWACEFEQISVPGIGFIDPLEPVL